MHLQSDAVPQLVEWSGVKRSGVQRNACNRLLLIIKLPLLIFKYIIYREDRYDRDIDGTALEQQKRNQCIVHAQPPHFTRSYLSYLLDSVVHVVEFYERNSDWDACCCITSAKKKTFTFCCCCFRIRSSICFDLCSVSSQIIKTIFRSSFFIFFFSAKY